MYGRRYDGLAVVVDICSSDHGDDVVESSKEQGFGVSNCRETRMLAFHVTFEDFVNFENSCLPTSSHLSLLAMIVYHSLPTLHPTNLLD
jgi:hypothetical protein